MNTCDIEVVRAASAWRKARSRLVNLPINSPEGKTALNALSEAEDKLSRAVVCAEKTSR